MPHLGIIIIPCGNGWRLHKKLSYTAVGWGNEVTEVSILPPPSHHCTVNYTIPPPIATWRSLCLWQLYLIVTHSTCGYIRYLYNHSFTLEFSLYQAMHVIICQQMQVVILSEIVLGAEHIQEARVYTFITVRTAAASIERIRSDRGHSRLSRPRTLQRHLQGSLILYRPGRHTQARYTYVHVDVTSHSRATLTWPKCQGCAFVVGT